MIRNSRCLNGWWDFQPVYTDRLDEHIEPKAIPTEGWLKEAYLVPSSWMKGEPERKMHVLLIKNSLE